MGQVTTQLEDKDLAKVQRKPELESGANKLGKTAAFDLLKDPLVDPLGSDDGSESPLTPDALEAQEGAQEPLDLQSPVLQDTGSEDQQGDEEEEQGDSPGLQGNESETENQEEDGPDSPDSPERDEEQEEDEPEEPPQEQKPSADAKGDPSPKETPTQDKPGAKDNVQPGADTSDTEETSTDGSTGGTGGDGMGADGRLLDFAELSQDELNGYINEKAWHDYWVNRSDTGMATSDKLSLVGRAMGAGMLDGLVNGVSAGLIQGVMAGALKKVRFAGGVFTAVEIFKMGPLNWATQTGDKFKGAADKWQTGDTIDKVEAALDVLDGINTIIGQISGICLMVAGLGSIVAVASIFFPFLLPIVPFLLTVIPMAANWGMMLGKINAIIGAVLTFLRLIPIGMRATQILLSDGDPALQAARAEKLTKQVSSFTEDASSRVVKSGTEKATGKVMEQGSKLFSGKSIASPQPEASNKVDATDKKHSKLKELFRTAFDLDQLSPKAVGDDFKAMNKQTRANTADVNQIKQQNTALQNKNSVANESTSKANGLENLHSSLTQNMMSGNKVSKGEMKLWGQVGSDATSARGQANVDSGRQQKTHDKYKNAVLGKLAFSEHHGGEDFTGDQAKAWRDRGMGLLTTSGNDGALESLKGLPDDGSVGGTDLPDDKLKATNPELYKIKMARAVEAQKSRAGWTDGARNTERTHNSQALEARKKAFPLGVDEFSSGQAAYSDRIMDTGTATSMATVDATMTPQQRQGMNDAQKSARDALRPQIQAAMDRISATRDGLQALPPPPDSQESILTNAADNWAKMDLEIKSLEGMKGELARQKAAAQAQSQVANKAVEIGQKNVDNASKEQQTLKEKEEKRKKAREDMMNRQRQGDQAISPISGFMAGVADMVGYLMRLAGVLPDSVGGDQLKGANPQGLQTGLSTMVNVGGDTKSSLGKGVTAVGKQDQLGATASNWMNSGYTGLLTISARLAKDKAESQAASQQYVGAEATLIDRMAKLEAGREAQRQRHSAAMATLNTWTQAHRAERMKKQGQLDQDLNAVDALLKQAGQPTSAQVG